MKCSHMLYAKGAFKAQGHKKVERKGQKTYELNIKQSKKESGIY